MAVALDVNMETSQNGGVESGGPVRMLVVDDDVTVLGLIEDVLSGESDVALEAHHDSERALARLREAEFDVMITDLKMPSVDGLTLLRELRELGRETLVIIITGYATMESCLEAMRHGAYDYMTKPFRIDELLHTVRNLVSQIHMRREMRRIERELGAVSEALASERQAANALRTRVTELEEENAAMTQLLQRAGISPRPTPARPQAGASPYPRVAERRADRVTRELERLAQLEEAGAISPAEAERARQKIQETRL